MNCCSYCCEKGHTINNCTRDVHLKDILYKDNDPNFFVMDLRTLKRIASLVHLKTSNPKIQIACQLTKYWHDIHFNKDPDDCPICFEKITSVNKSITKCKHTFCTSCLLQHNKYKNTCPLCRQTLYENTGTTIQYGDGYYMEPELIIDTTSGEGVYGLGSRSANTSTNSDRELFMNFIQSITDNIPDTMFNTIMETE
jgi:hypothetical protein